MFKRMILLLTAARLRYTSTSPSNLISSILSYYCNVSGHDSSMETPPMINASPGTPIETLYDGMVPDGSSTRHQGGINAEDVESSVFISSF